MHVRLNPERPVCVWLITRAKEGEGGKLGDGVQILQPHPFPPLAYTSSLAGAGGQRARFQDHVRSEGSPCAPVSPQTKIPGTLGGLHRRESAAARREERGRGGEVWCCAVYIHAGGRMHAASENA